MHALASALAQLSESAAFALALTLREIGNGRGILVLAAAAALFPHRISQLSVGVTLAFGLHGFLLCAAPVLRSSDHGTWWPWTTSTSKHSTSPWTAENSTETAPENPEAQPGVFFTNRQLLWFDLAGPITWLAVGVFVAVRYWCTSPPSLVKFRRTTSRSVDDFSTTSTVDDSTTRTVDDFSKNPFSTTSTVDDSTIAGLSDDGEDSLYHGMKTPAGQSPARENPLDHIHYGSTLIWAEPAPAVQDDLRSPRKNSCDFPHTVSSLTEVDAPTSWRNCCSAESMSIAVFFTVFAFFAEWNDRGSRLLLARSREVERGSLFGGAGLFSPSSAGLFSPSSETVTHGVSGAGVDYTRSIKEHDIWLLAGCYGLLLLVRLGAGYCGCALGKIGDGRTVLVCAVVVLVSAAITEGSAVAADFLRPNGDVDGVPLDGSAVSGS